jgi:ATP-dependent exoDNAse (exonuclease V) beta subunit|tara:strand:+ start:120 stop:884 length:765 start_codon:yes stop_codon:yes gene_type:complete
MTEIKKSFNRILEISDDHKQITLPDGRYYQRNGEYYPSVTYVLSYYPKGKFFEDWLKKVGYASEYIVKKAGEEGTLVHEMIEDYLNGKELNFLQHGIPMYDPKIWQMFMRFVDFWEKYNPTLIEAEVHLFSDELKIAGTCDMVCEIDGEIWVIDFKTSNNLQTTYDLQTALYSKCFEECFNKKINRTGVLWLKSSKRGPKTGKMQGKGWEVHESKRTQEENIDIYKTIRKLFDLENPSHKPAFTQFKTTAKRNL